MTVPATTLVLLCAGAAALSGATQTPFIGRTDVVTVNVSVRQGNVAVAGLGAADFRVFDDGAIERVNTVAVDSVPIDATLFLDTSASTAGALPAMIAAVQRISEKLRPGDRFRVLTIGRSVYQTIPWTPAGASVDLKPRFFGGMSLIRDAIAMAIRHHVEPGRRHIVVALTDGQDCGSVVRPDTLVAEASRSDAVVHWVRMGLPARSNALGPIGRCSEDGIPDGDPDSLEAVAKRTGGLKHASLFRVDPVKVFDQILEDFRASYVITFIPAEVPHAGWHPLRVEVAEKKYTIRARAGYDGGS